ncbi:hypothetical protein GS881_03430 [Rhodococcus hoagii]|nr:hypothetical protein [Prescottella equi]
MPVASNSPVRLVLVLCALTRRDLVAGGQPEPIEHVGGHAVAGQLFASPGPGLPARLAAQPQDLGGQAFAAVAQFAPVDADVERKPRLGGPDRNGTRAVDSGRRGRRRRRWGRKRFSHVTPIVGRDAHSVGR